MKSPSAIWRRGYRCGEHTPIRSQEGIYKIRPSCRLRFRLKNLKPNKFFLVGRGGHDRKAGRRWCECRFSFWREAVYLKSVKKWQSGLKLFSVLIFWILFHQGKSIKPQRRMSAVDIPFTYKMLRKLSMTKRFKS